jgi:hypothetical protein
MNTIIDFILSNLFAVVSLIGIFTVYLMTRTMAKYDKLKNERRMDDSEY